MASEYQKRAIAESQARAKAGITMSNDPRTSKTRKSSSSTRTTNEQVKTVQIKEQINPDIKSQLEKQYKEQGISYTQDELNARAAALTRGSYQFQQASQPIGSQEFKKVDEGLGFISPDEKITKLPSRLQQAKNTGQISYDPNVIAKTEADAIVGARQRESRGISSKTKQAFIDQQTGSTTGGEGISGQYFTQGEERVVDVYRGVPFKEKLTSREVGLASDILTPQGKVSYSGIAKRVGTDVVLPAALTGGAIGTGLVATSGAGIATTLGTGALFSIPVGVGTQKIAEESALGSLTGEQRQTIEAEGFSQAAFTARKATSTEVLQPKWSEAIPWENVKKPIAWTESKVRGLVSAAPFGERLLGGSDIFESNLSQQLRAQGYSESQISNIFKSGAPKGWLGAKDTGELTGLLAQSATIEATGAFALGKASSQGLLAGSKLKTFGEVGLITGSLGAAEGYGQSLTQQLARKGEVSQVEAFTSGAAGTVSAGIFGGAIGTKVLGRKAETLLIPFDVIEKPAEFIAGLSSGISTASSKIKTKVVSLTPSFTSTPSQSQDVTMAYNFGKGGQPTVSLVPTTTETEQKKPSTKVTSLSNIPSSTQTQTSTRTQTQTQTNIPSLVPTNIPSEVPSWVPTQTITETSTRTQNQTQTNIPSLVPTNIPSEVPSWVPTQTITETLVPTQTQTNVFTNTFTPQLDWGTLPLLPFLPGGGGGRGARSRLRKVSQPKDYVSSLGSAVLGIKGSKTEAGVISGLGIRPLQTGPSPKRRASKKRKRR